MSYFIVVLSGGIAQGAVFGLVGLALASLFSATRVINLAAGELVMVCAVLTAVMFANGQSGVLVAVTVVAFGLLVLSPALYGVVRGLQRRRAEAGSLVLGVLGLALLIQGVTGAVTHFQQQRLPAAYVPGALNVAGARVSWTEIVILATAMAVGGSYWWLERRTLLGLALRATGDDPEVTRLAGVPTQWVIMAAVTVSVVVTAVAGVVLAPLIAPSAIMGAPLLIGGFVAAVFGGLTNPYGALAGGLVIGVVRGLAQGYIHSGSGEAVTFIVLLLVLATRPRGVFAPAQ